MPAHSLGALSSPISSLIRGSGVWKYFFFFSNHVLILLGCIVTKVSQTEQCPSSHSKVCQSRGKVDTHPLTFQLCTAFSLEYLVICSRVTVNTSLLTFPVLLLKRETCYHNSEARSLKKWNKSQPVPAPAPRPPCSLRPCTLQQTGVSFSLVLGAFSAPTSC